MRPQEYVINGQRFVVEIVSSDGRNAEVRVNGVAYRVEVPPEAYASAALPPVPRPPVAPAPVPAAAPVSAPPAPPRARSSAKAPAATKPAVAASSSPENQVVSPMPGTILKVFVEAGQTVRAGEALMILEAMKMENEIHAPRDGAVKRVHVSTGTEVQAGSLLVEFEAA